MLASLAAKLTIRSAPDHRRMDPFMIAIWSIFSIGWLCIFLDYFLTIFVVKDPGIVSGSDAVSEDNKWKKNLLHSGLLAIGQHKKFE